MKVQCPDFWEKITSILDKGHIGSDISRFTSFETPLATPKTFEGFMCLYMGATIKYSFIKFFVRVVPDSDPSFWPLTALHELHVTMQPLFDRLGGTHPHYSKEAHKWLFFGILGDFWTYRSLCDQILEKLESGYPHYPPTPDGGPFVTQARQRRLRGGRIGRPPYISAPRRSDVWLTWLAPHP